MLTTLFLFVEVKHRCCFTRVFFVSLFSLLCAWVCGVCLHVATPRTHNNKEHHFSARFSVSSMLRHAHSDSLIHESQHSTLRLFTTLRTSATAAFSVVFYRRSPPLTVTVTHSATHSPHYINTHSKQDNNNNTTTNTAQATAPPPLHPTTTTPPPPPPLQLRPYSSLS